MLDVGFIYKGGTAIDIFRERGLLSQFNHRCIFPIQALFDKLRKDNSTISIQACGDWGELLVNLCESHGSIISIAYQGVGIMKSCRYYVPGTLNNEFFKWMDVWWNNHFLCSNLESSNWTNKKWLFRVPGRYHVYLGRVCGRYRTCFPCGHHQICWSEIAGTAWLLGRKSPGSKLPTKPKRGQQLTTRWRSIFGRFFGPNELTSPSYSPNLCGSSTAIWVDDKKLPLKNLSDRRQVKWSWAWKTTAQVALPNSASLCSYRWLWLVYGWGGKTPESTTRGQLLVYLWYICSQFFGPAKLLPGKINLNFWVCSLRGLLSLVSRSVLSQVVWTNHCDYPMGIHIWYEYACTTIS